MGSVCGAITGGLMALGMAGLDDADIINDFDGKLPEMNITVFPRILAPMLNDYADEQGWAERYSGKDVGRLLPTSIFVTHEGQKQMLQIQQLVINALYVDTGETDEKN